MSSIKIFSFLLIIPLFLINMGHSSIEEKELALKYAPIIMLDKKEPFVPYKVGFTVYKESSPSTSFNREILLTKGEICIEYSVYWDFDIEHMYDLEHIWVYIKDNKITKLEGSWHGKYKNFSKFKLVSEKPVIYVQPGKHAFLASPGDFVKNLFVYFRTIIPCLFMAGRKGLLQKGFHIKLDKKEEEAIRKYLKNFSFFPSFSFSQRFTIDENILLPWEELKEKIPQRIISLLRKLCGSKI